MALETGTYVSDLVETNPPGTDQKSQGDDHLRLIKDVLKNTFPDGSRAFQFEGVTTDKTGAYTVVIGDDRQIVPVDTTSGNITISLTAVGSLYEGFWFSIYKTVAANTVTVDPNSTEQIDDATTKTISGGPQLLTFAIVNGEWRTVSQNLTSIVNEAQSEAIRIDSSGNVGIGTSSPGNLLDLNAAASPTLRLSDATSYSQIVHQTANGSLLLRADDGNAVSGSLIVFEIDNSELARLTSGGRFGIGTTSPDGPLHVESGTAGTVSAFVGANTLVIEGSDANNVGMTILSPNTAVANIFFGDPDSSTVGRIQYDHSADYMRFFTSNAERVRIDSAGNVIIGGTTAGAVLDVAGNIKSRASGAEGGELLLENAGGTGNAGVIDINASDVLRVYQPNAADGGIVIGMLNASNTNPIRFLTANAEAMRITSAGVLEMNGNAVTESPTTARAWVNYDQTTPTIVDDYQVTSVTDTATGIFTVNFTITLPNANYAAAGCAEGSASTTAQFITLRNGGTKSTTACEFISSRQDGAELDVNQNCPIIFATGV